MADRLGLNSKDVIIGPRSIYVMALCKRLMGRKFRAEEQNRLLFWYVHAALRRGNAAPRPTLVSDIRAAREAENPVEGLLNHLAAEHGTLDIMPSQLDAKRRSLHYSLLYLITRLGESRDWGTGNVLRHGLLGDHSQLHVHHIFPRAKLKQESIEKEMIDQLANLSFQTAETNQALGAKLPKDYLLEIEEQMPGALESQWIPVDRDLWEMENYPAFLEARRELLANGANELLQRLRDGDP